VTGTEGMDGVDPLEGVVLRYGNLYGPGTGWSEDGVFVELVRRRRLPIVGDGAGIWSFVHVDDAATATVAAIERGEPGVYNVSDDEPSAVSVWLPALATILEAKPPRHVPAWLGRLTVGAAGLSLFTEIRGASNAKARRELGWRLLYSSWREGFARGLADSPVDAGAAASLIDPPPHAEEPAA
jgi:nucleoside-diphosphate-sugar epimerase